MADVVEKRTELFFQEGNSDKVYNASLIVHDDGTCSVAVEWGRRGSSLNSGNKAVKVPRAKAVSTFDRLVREKTNKGYQAITAEVAPAAVAPPEGEGSGSLHGVKKRATVGKKAQLLNPIEEEELQRFLDDHGWFAQQKIDGIRVLSTIQKDRILPTNRDGQETDNVGASLLTGLDSLPIGSVVDGEVLGDVYWLFDVLQVGEKDVSHLPALTRWQLLDEELSPGLSGDICVLPTAATPQKKKELYQRLVDNGAEGIVFKDASAPYKAGRPASGGPQRKHKLIKSVDVVVVDNAGNAYEMAVYDGAKRVSIGKVFAGTTNESRKALDAALAAGQQPVCEVRYLYATDDDQLYQPVFVRARTDKAAAACVRAQLKKTNKSVLS